MEIPDTSSEDDNGGVRVFCRFRPDTGMENRIEEDQNLVSKSKTKTPATPKTPSNSRRQKGPYYINSSRKASNSDFEPGDSSGSSMINLHDDEKTVSFSRNSKVMKTYMGASTDCFTFDKVFNDTSTQEEVYNTTTKPLIDEVLKGYNCTVFAYGQTGSGKTHTMMGSQSGFGINKDMDFNGTHSEIGMGIIPRVAKDLFRAMFESSEDIEFTIKVSFVEIYMERIRDLLNPSKGGSLKIRESKDDLVVEGVQENYVSDPKDLLELIDQGNENRSISSTLMNAESSRSHSVFMITISQVSISSNVNKASKLFMVDLAGSEMVKRTGAQFQVLEELYTYN
mmetsp:Transcript_28371/g.34633  ORF Transcript_28371/g.34633 Transcript_28371/m.34633 type:complete len:339 (-) Transcript_28371:1932-2948(-)